MNFPFARLPLELILEVVRIGASPDCSTALHRPSYATAISLASTSSMLCSIAMPHLLRTVVLCTTDHVIAFIESIVLQRKLLAMKPASRLALEYPRLVRRFWCTECAERHPFSAGFDLDYGALYSVLRNLDCLGLDFRAMHLLYNSLASPGADPQYDWLCRRVVFAGKHPRWNPLKMSAGGTHFFSHITHISLWIHDAADLSATNSIPTWLQDVPLTAMPKLTHMTVLLDSASDPECSPGSVLVCSRDSTGRPSFQSQQDLLALYPVHDMTVKPRASAAGDSVWEFSFMRGEDEVCWTCIE
ncbi:unnamed protein product [Mycena citricolor]|uniref:Uncharacterized protein n=1 Tax=Mycena citricolor TaxID=2018698 RepID=A0AAD2HTF1_9AGAR|nr:unnamed protein product [Mycena citricolor]